MGEKERERGRGGIVPKREERWELKGFLEVFGNYDGMN